MDRENQNLPVWRLIGAILVLAGLAGVLLALAPVYFENYELGQYVRSLARAANAGAVPDETLRSEVLDRARQLDLPVEAGDIRISHTEGKVQVQMKYAVNMDFPVYQVDLHFHPSVTSP
jgi:hypothetical protein